MRILKVELDDFRNIEKAELTPSPRFTALVGPNGQGKTNAIEAVYLVAALRPLRNVARRALIRAGTERARLMLKIESAQTGLVHDLELLLEPRSRALLKDGKRSDTASFLGLAVAVSFTPDDLQLLKGGPEGRRRFLDRALLNIRPSYLTRALRYARAVRERNRILFERGPEDVLEAYDQVVAEEGAFVSLARARYIDELGPYVEAHFRQIATPAPALSLRYVSGLDATASAAEDALKARLLERLSVKREDDRRRKTTSIGPHHDDLELRLDGALVRDRASQGQHRALVLALKLAEITHLEARLGEPPILLLDDMSSELDRRRSEQLFDAIRGRRGQVLLTGTEEPRAFQEGALAASSEPLVVYDVEAGHLTKRA